MSFWRELKGLMKMEILEALVDQGVSEVPAWAVLEAFPGCPELSCGHLAEDLKAALRPAVVDSEIVVAEVCLVILQVAVAAPGAILVGLNHRLAAASGLLMSSATAPVEPGDPWQMS